ncbi:hypothetical protein D3C85_1819610 [compost metagenome]
MPYMARSEIARHALFPTLNSKSRAVMATAGANFSLTGSMTVGVSSSTAISSHSGSRSQRHIQRVNRHHTNRQPKAAKA